MDHRHQPIESTTIDDRRLCHHHHCLELFRTKSSTIATTDPKLHRPNLIMSKFTTINSNTTIRNINNTSIISNIDNNYNRPKLCSNFEIDQGEDFDEVRKSGTKRSGRRRRDRNFDRSSSSSSSSSSLSTTTTFSPCRRWWLWWWWWPLTTNQISKYLHFDQTCSSSMVASQRFIQSVISTILLLAKMFSSQLSFALSPSLSSKSSRSTATLSTSIVSKFRLQSLLLLLTIVTSQLCHGYDYGGGGGSYSNAPQSNYQQSHYQPIYPQPQYNYRKYYKPYVPMPQFCPETGRTVCSKVAPFYPSDEVFAVLKTARAKHFNISSEFVDESDNFADPHLDDMEPFPEPEPFHHHRPNVATVGTGFGHHQLPSMIPINGPVGSRYPYTFNKAFNQGYTQSDPNYYSVTQQQQRDYQMSTIASTPMVPYQSTKSIYRAQATHNYHNSRYKRQAPGNNDPTANEPICPSRIILIEPKAAMNDKRQWKFVVNLSERDPRLKQAIKVEVCTTPNQPCSNQISLPFGFISRCRQKYIKKKMISLDPSGQSISSENFFAPSCCVCEVIRQDDSTLATRSSNQINTIAKPAKNHHNNNDEKKKKKKKK